MELISIITAIILTMITLSSKKLLFSFKIILSAITAYGIYKFLYPEMYIINPIDWGNHIKEWIQKDFVFVLLLTVTSYLLFNHVIRFIIINGISNPLNKLTSKSLSKKPDFFNKISKFIIIKYVRKAVRKMRILGLIKSSTEKNPDPINYEDFSESIYSAFTTTIHIWICWYILDINDYFSAKYLIVIIVAILLYILIALPFGRIVFKDISGVIEHESDLISKKLI